MTTTTAYMTEPDTQEHTLVVIFLRGGADGLNMVIPTEDDDYHRARPLIGISKNKALPLDSLFGLNPELSPLIPLYEEGMVSIVHQAGCEDESRSHFEAQDFMEQGGTAASGWLGRFLRYAPNVKGGPLSAIALGKTRPTCLWGAPSSLTMESFESFGIGEATPAFVPALAQLYGSENNALGQAGADALSAMVRIEALKSNTYSPNPNAIYPQGAFGDGLRQVAQMVKARVGLEAVSLDLNGWDSHFATSSLMNPLMRDLSNGLAALRNDLGSEMKRVTVAVMSEFGRRVYQNVSFGTDHGRGGVMFLMGGDIQGGTIHHNWKGLKPEHLAGAGDLTIEYNYRDVLAPILKRHGGLESLDTVFPDYGITPMALYG